MRRFLVLLMLIMMVLPASSSSLRARARSNAVLTSNDVYFSFSHNPAFLSAKDYSVSLPISARVNNVSTLLKSDLINDIKDLSSMDEQRMMASLLDLLRDFNGTMPLLTLSESISFTKNGFGMSLRVEQEVITDGGSVGASLSAAIKGEMATGIGFSYDWKDYYLALGIAPKFSFRLSTSPVGIDTAVAIMLDNSLFDNVEIYQEIALSADAGLYASFPYGFKASLVLRDLGYAIDGTASLDLATGWGNKWGIISLDTEIGLKDVTHLRTNVDLMRSFNASVSLSITDFITFDAGLSGGYPSLGIEADIFFINLTLAYYFEDYGIVYGLSPRDTFAIEISLLL